MKDIEKHTNMAEGRQTFVKTMLILAAGTLVGRWFGKSSKRTNNIAETGEKIKMLTADGKLVEIDRAYITKKGHKASGSDIQNWLKRQA
jgi:hypothetical protein